METLIWAIGSMFVLLLIIYLLPLGFSKKGKLAIVLTGFALALTGLAAVTAIPLWETALLLAVLIFFIAYFMDSRLANSIYLEKKSVIDEFEIETETSVLNSPIVKNDIYIDNSTNDLQLPPIVNVDGKTEQPLFELKVDEVTENKEEDISFLLDSGVEALIAENEQLESDVFGDLSNIEIILDEPSDSEEETSENNWLDELLEMEDSLSKQTIVEEKMEKPAEILLAKKEAASSLEEDDTLPILELKR
jgi:hypothetical protein